MTCLIRSYDTRFVKANSSYSGRNAEQLHEYEPLRQCNCKRKRTANDLAASEADDHEAAVRTVLGKNDEVQGLVQVPGPRNGRRKHGILRILKVLVSLDININLCRDQ